MRVHGAKVARVVVSSAVFVVFLLGFFLATPVVDAAVRGLSRIQFLPSFISLAIAGAGYVGIAWIVVLAATAVFGRLYCSSVCPLGTTQDGIIRLTRAVRGKWRFHHRTSRVGPARAIGALTVALLVAGAPLLVNVFGPYRFFGMLVKDLLTPVVALASHGAYFALRPFGVFVSPMVVPVDGVLLLVALFAAAALIVVTGMHGRVYCNTVCPVGGILSLLSRRSLFAIRIDPETCTRCGACEHACKAGCIESKEKTVDAARCITCFNCLSVCPVDAIHYKRSATAREKVVNTEVHEAPRVSRAVSRRGFLHRVGRFGVGSLSIFPVSFLLRRRATAPDGSPNAPASPPGSQSVGRFSSLCVACHLCVTRCPTGVLRPSLLEYGFKGLMQPTMDYGTAFCEYECNVCSQVCPTAAIMPISLAVKKETQIGQVRFLRDRCVVVTNGTACGACAEVCPTHAVYMVGHKDGLTIPETDVDVCVGCGNCEYACPVLPGKAIYVEGNEVHRRREVKSAEDTVETIDTGESGEFPF